MSDQASPARRRHFLVRLAGLGAAPLLPGAGRAVAADGPSPATLPPPAGYQSLGLEEAALVEQLVNVMCPADSLTPSGVDCGLAVYIDRQLAGAFGQGAGRYLAGPWTPAPPQAGPQWPGTPEQHFKAGLRAVSELSLQRHGQPFDLLAPALAEQLLQEIQAGRADGVGFALGEWFNELLYPLFVQGCFADPVYGGNAGKVFWRLIGYPGLPATHSRDMVAYRGKPYPGAARPAAIPDFS
ncbi:MAG TPA: gluconate 2-dehydrogenase subunit 3 family protein [Pseudoduganella sp.]